MKNKSTLHWLIFEIWYDYMFRKYRSSQEVDNRQVASQFHYDVTVFGEFVANAIYHVFG